MLLVLVLAFTLSFQAHLLDFLNHQSTFEIAIVGIEELGTDRAIDFIKKSDLPLDTKIKAIRRLECRGAFYEP